MRLDYPLELINSKLPHKQPSYYQKLLFGLFAGVIALLFFLLVAGAPQTTVSLFLVIFGFAMGFVFLAFCLSKLYNDESDARDFVAIYFPSLVASPSFNVAYKAFKGVSRWLLVLFTYILLFMLVLLMGLIVAARIES